MSDRKYRQRGYQDEERDRAPKPSVPRKPPEPGAPAGARRLSSDSGPKTIQMPGFREVVRCTQCGTVIAEDIGLATRCMRCGADLHTCAQCTYFDPGSRFECMRPIPARVSPKNERNTCAEYSPRATVERETTTPRVDDARKAFDDLFKF